jgi:type IV pilus assembly protein PilW
MLIKYNKGFSLIELMLAMMIGIIIIGGVLSLYINSRDTQRAWEDQMQLLFDSRFVMETIGYDLRHAGVFGRNNMPRTIHCGSYDTSCDVTDKLPLAVDDCVNEWYISLDQPMVASDDNAIIDGADYSGTCASKGYKSNTDMLGVHYADPTRIQDDQLAASLTYVRSNTVAGGLFVGSVIPGYETYKWESQHSWHPVNNPTGATSNHRLVGHLYYVSDYTDAVGDGVPSLRRAELESGPAMNDQVLLSGVEDMQLQFGVTTSGTPSAFPDTYVAADNIPTYPGTANKDWSRVRSVKIWILMRSEREDRDISSVQTFTIAGNSVTTPSDGYYRKLFSGIINLRNTIRLDESAASGG